VVEQFFREIAMNTNTVDDVLRNIRTSKPYVDESSELTPPMVLQSEVKPPVSWEAADIEAAIEVKLPDEIKILWSRGSEIRLHSDVNYGQWGCILWSPAEVVARHRDASGWRGPGDFRPGDLIIGEFRGDTDLVILRCDPSKEDFGSIIIALPMDPRDAWPCVASSIIEFIHKFLSDPDKKFWERGR
jgi:hypothetical protein